MRAVWGSIIHHYIHTYYIMPDGFSYYLGGGRKNI